jgi:hypothetical protein
MDHRNWRRMMSEARQNGHYSKFRRYFGRHRVTNVVQATVTLGVLLLIFLGTIGFFVVRTYDKLQQQIHSQCAQDADVGNLEVTITPGQKRPSVNLIALVHDFRAGYEGLGCLEVTGPLKPPDKLYIKWAKRDGYQNPS